MFAITKPTNTANNSSKLVRALARCHELSVRALAIANVVVSENTGLHTIDVLVLSDLINESYLESSDASNGMIPLLHLLKSRKTEEKELQLWWHYTSLEI